MVNCNKLIHQFCNFLLLFMQLKNAYKLTVAHAHGVGQYNSLTFRHRASCIFGQAFPYSPENAFYIFNQQIYFII